MWIMDKQKDYTPIATQIFRFMLLLIVPIIATTLFQTLVSAHQLSFLLQKETNQIMKQVDSILSFSKRNIELTSDVIAQDPSVLSFLSGDPLTQEDEEHLRQLLSILENDARGITNIIICRSDGKWISNSLSQRSRDSLLRDSWYQDTALHPGKLLFYSNPAERNLISAYGYSSDEVIAVTTALCDTDGTVLGVLSMDFMIEYLDSEIGSLIVGSNGFIYITDPAGNIIFAPRNLVVQRIDSAKLVQHSEVTKMISVDDVLYQVSNLDSSVFPWMIFGVFHYSDISWLPNTIRDIALIFLLITILLAFIFSRNLNHLIVEPILELNKCMKQVESGDLNVTFQSNNENEIGILGNSFNKMMQHTNELLVLLKRESDEKRAAEYRILQEQIKPHFLYNTLETIHWMAIETGNSDISELILDLTQFFKLSLSGGNEFIPLEKEIEHISSYLSIQKVRYEDLFSFSITCAPETPKCSVLKLILQPIVENALYHGIKEDTEPGYIHIDIRPDKNDLLFRIEDTGVGLSEKSTAQLNQRLVNKQKGIGYGLYNVNCRLTYHFGDRYHLWVESTAGAGTTVYIRHPIQ